MSRGCGPFLLSRGSHSAAGTPGGVAPQPGTAASGATWQVQGTIASGLEIATCKVIEPQQGEAKDGFLAIVLGEAYLRNGWRRLRAEAGVRLGAGQSPTRSPPRRSLVGAPRPPLTRPTRTTPRCYHIQRPRWTGPSSKLRIFHWRTTAHLTTTATTHNPRLQWHSVRHSVSLLKGQVCLRPCHGYAMTEVPVATSSC